MSDEQGDGRDQAGRFLPGQSGNPGGRPTRDQVVLRRLRRRASAALSSLLDAIEGGGAVIVIDAREVLENWWDREVDAVIEKRPPTDLERAHAAGREAAYAAGDAVRARYEGVVRFRPVGGETPEWGPEGGERPPGPHEMQRLYVDPDTGERLTSWQLGALVEAAEGPAYQAAHAAALAALLAEGQPGQTGGGVAVDEIGPVGAEGGELGGIPAGRPAPVVPQAALRLDGGGGAGGGGEAMGAENGVGGGEGGTAAETIRQGAGGGDELQHGTFLPE